jgi:4-hydroxybenzoate polyprenyltransferase
VPSSAAHSVAQTADTPNLAPYLRLARIHNLVPSALLVVVGAWAGSGHRVSAIASASVWVMGAISGGIAIASVVVNDYFDLKIDATNAPDKPLPSGASSSLPATTISKTNSDVVPFASLLLYSFFTSPPHTHTCTPGAVTPDAAILLSCLLYCGCLIAACLMEPSGLRSIVAFSAAATLLYTPLFKRLTAVKNATVAIVIALAPLAGALAAGAVRVCVLV